MNPQMLRAALVLWALVLMAGCPGLRAQSPKGQAPKDKAAAAQPYTPDLKRWRLDLTPDPGGWMSGPTPSLRLKIVDPQDPDPPKDDEPAFNPYAWDEGEGEGEYVERSPEEWERLRQEEEAREKANAWRDRKVLLWFNGERLEQSLRVGYRQALDLPVANGENRLEILQPDSGLRLVRTWWAGGKPARLRITRGDGSWAGGSLEVLEPGGGLAKPGVRTSSGALLTYAGVYTSSTPQPGTYTLRLSGGWRGGSPQRVRVEAVLDAGTESERRWVFERLVLPGSGPVTLGTLEVEP